ncbi:hypothetical protein BH23GEM4_BH23GEM4_16740 [soil metagenome]
MERALREVASREPHLRGRALAEALSATGWVDLETALRLLPCYRNFDPDRYFAEHLRSISFRGETVAADFRAGVRRALHDLLGGADSGELGSQACLRFGAGEREGVVLAYPQVNFALGPEVSAAAAAALDELPEAFVLVARNFRDTTAAQLSGILARSDVSGTLLTVNLLLGMRAVVLRYRPEPARVFDLLAAGRPIRSADVARLGDR